MEESREGNLKEWLIHFFRVFIGGLLWCNLERTYQVLVSVVDFVCVFYERPAQEEQKRGRLNTKKELILFWARAARYHRISLIDEDDFNISPVRSIISCSDRKSGCEQEQQKIVSRFAFKKPTQRLHKTKTTVFLAWLAHYCDSVEVD